MKVWKVMADGVVYLLLFLTTSGIFLWWFLKAERRLGYMAIGLGVFTFSTLLLLVFYLLTTHQCQPANGPSGYLVLVH